MDSNIDTSANLFGKVVTDLQEDITIAQNNAIHGTLFWVTDYTGFSDTVSEQSGNYLALHITNGVPSIQVRSTIPGPDSGYTEYRDATYKRTGDYYVIRIDTLDRTLKIEANGFTNYYSLGEIGIMVPSP